MAYDLLLLIAGLAFLGMALLPRALRSRPIGLPPLYVALGLLLALAPGIVPDVVPIVDVRRHTALVERLTELGVIVALTGAGLKVGRPIGLRAWAPTWRLLAVTMPLCIAAGAWLGWAWLGLAPAAALLLAAALAPTDPVLAGDVQAPPPRRDGPVSVPVSDVGADGGADDGAGDGTGGANAGTDGGASGGTDGGANAGTDGEAPTDEHEVRFALTSEAGLNDGLAFPFVHAALLLAAGGGWGHLALDWTLGPLLYKCGAGLAVGWLVGRGMAWLAFRAGRLRLARAGEGFVALAMTLLAYGAGQLAQGYGFLSVFVAAATLRAQERHHGYHGVLHESIDQMERLLLAVLLLLFGAALAHGLLAGLGWRGAAFAAAFLLVVRPVAGFVAVRGVLPPRAAVAASFLGIRGIGSLYYLAFGLRHGGFEDADLLWATASAVVLLSVVLHGITAKPVMGWVQRGGGRGRPRSRRPTAPPASPRGRPPPARPQTTGTAPPPPPPRSR